MDKKLDIIDYPLKIRNRQDFVFCKHKTRYEFKILESVDSKTVFVSKKKTALILWLEVDDNACHVLGHTSSLYEFDVPVDFYVDQSESAEYYRSLCRVLINGSIDEAFAFKLPETFPPYVPPLINYSERSAKLAQPDCELKIDKVRSKITKVYYTDSIPTDMPSVNYKRTAQSEHIRNFIENISYPVLKMQQIQKLFKEYKKKHNLAIKHDYVRQYMPLHRYYVMDGPFRKSWIIYGYDPKSNVDNYKFQVIDLRLEGTFLHLYECPEVIEEVEKNRDWYLKKECDIKNGFFKQTLCQLILYHRYIQFSDSSDEEYFELLD